MALVKLTYRYRGRIDFQRIYHEGKQFWLKIVDETDFAESKHKDKGKEFEFKWTVEHKIDVYYKIVYTVEAKAEDMKPVTITEGGKERNIFEGKIRFFVSPDVEENYTVGNPAGKKELFKEGSLLHKLYKRITLRQKEEDLEGEAIIVAQEFISEMKKICGAHARY